MEALLNQLAEANITQQSMHRELLKEQRQQNALLQAELSQLTAAHARLVAGPAVSQPKPSMFILKLTEADDIEAYFQVFERTAVPMAPGAMGKLIGTVLVGSGTEDLSRSNSGPGGELRETEKGNNAPVWVHPDQPGTEMS